jgi:acyl carrier protein
VPQHFVELDAMPQTNNGKIDYKALPLPRVETTAPTEIAVPNTPAEKYLGSVWEEVLETDDIDLNDTFFDIGGHSLLVMKVISIVHEKTGIKLGPQDFLMCTLEQLADKIAESFAFKSENVDSRNPETQSVSEQEKTGIDSHKSNETEKNQDSSSAPKKTGVFRNLKGFWD